MSWITRFVANASRMSGGLLLALLSGLPTQALAQSSSVKSSIFDAGGGPAQSSEASFRTSIGGFGGRLTSASGNVVAATGFPGRFAVLQGQTNASVVVDLALALSDAPDPVRPGNPLVYSAVVTNRGPNAATEVVLECQLPVGIAFVSAALSQGSHSLDNTILTCRLGTITLGGAASVTVTVTPTAEGLLTCTATVNAAEADRDASDNAARQLTSVFRREPMTYTWQEADPGDWFVAGNWSPAGIPSAPDSIIVGSGTVLVPADVTVSGLFWKGGTLRGPGAVTIPPNGLVHLSGAQGLGLDIPALNNAGLMVWTERAWIYSPTAWPTINNSGRIEIRGEDGTALRHYGTPNVSLNNTGEIVKLGSASGVVLLPNGLTNQGTIRVQSGSLSLGGTGRGRGNFEVAAGARLECFCDYTQESPGWTRSLGLLICGLEHVLTFNGAELNAAYLWLGNGTINVHCPSQVDQLTIDGGQFGGTVNFTQPVRMRGLSLPGGTANLSFADPLSLQTVSVGTWGRLSCSNAVTVTNLNWTGGELRGVGPLTIPTTGVMRWASDGSAVLSVARLDNYGLCVWTNAQTHGRDRTLINNYGRFELQTDGRFHYWGEPTISLNNEGELIKSPATRTDGWTRLEFAGLTNRGTISVENGWLALAGVGRNTGRINVAANAHLSFYAGAYPVDFVFDAGGRVECAGVLDFDYGARFVQTGGTTLLQGGTLAGSTFEIGGGLVSGVGTISGDLLNGGAVAPGASPGRLLIQGNYTQTSAGVLDIELGGTSAGVDHDQLQVSGMASLEGGLHVRQFNGYVPGASDRFLILTAAVRRGCFSGLQSDDLGARGLSPRYLATGVELLQVAPVIAALGFDPRTRQVRLQMAEATGLELRIEASVDLVHWQPVYRAIVPEGQILELPEPDGTGSPYGFFRALVLP